MGVLGEIVVGLLEVTLGNVLEAAVPGPRGPRKLTSPAREQAVEAVLEGILLAVALDGRISDGELREVRARARKLWPLAPLGQWIDRARAAVAHVRTDDEATAAFLAIGRRLGERDRRILFEAVAALSGHDDQGRPDVAYLCGRALGYPDGETDALVERLAARARERRL